MAKPEVPDFDFDAHIAELIARSEETTHPKAKVGPRGWENDQALMKKGIMKRGKKGGDEYYEDDEEEEENMDEWSEADDEEDEEDGVRTRPTRGDTPPRGRGKHAPRASKKIDEDFENFLDGNASVHGLVVLSHTHALLYCHTSSDMSCNAPTYSLLLC